MKIDYVKLSLWMDEKEISNKEMADECEVSITCIRNIRAGASNGSKQLIGLIANVLDVPVSYILKDQQMEEWKNGRMEEWKIVSFILVFIVGVSFYTLENT